MYIDTVIIDETILPVFPQELLDRLRTETQSLTNYFLYVYINDNGQEDAPYNLFDQLIYDSDWVDYNHSGYVDHSVTTRVLNQLLNIYSDFSNKAHRSLSFLKMCNNPGVYISDIIVDRIHGLTVLKLTPVKEDNV